MIQCKPKIPRPITLFNSTAIKTYMQKYLFSSQLKHVHMSLGNFIMGGCTVCSFFQDYNHDSVNSLWTLAASIPRHLKEWYLPVVSHSQIVWPIKTKHIRPARNTQESSSKLGWFTLQEQPVEKGSSKAEIWVVVPKARKHYGHLCKKGYCMFINLCIYIYQK